jgi:hypothetical protein
MQRHPREREEAIRQQPSYGPTGLAPGTLALQRNAGNQALTRMITRSRLDRHPDHGQRNRKSKPSSQPQPVSFQVGSRPAFLTSTPARHAVYRLGSVVYGLAGDFGGVSIGPDKDGTGYRWATTGVLITQADADAFRSIAQNVACHMSYDVLTQNCYSPVIAALQDLLNTHGAATDPLNAPLTAMLNALRGDNFGAGTQYAVENANH